MKKFMAIMSLLLLLGTVGCTDNKITVTFDTRGGEELATITCDLNSQIDLPTPTREDAIFMGWYTDTNWGNKVTERPQIKETTVYYARWAPYQKITLDSQNYYKYLDISIIYTHNEKGVNTTIYEIYEIMCYLKECVILNGKEMENGFDELSDILFYITGFTNQIIGSIGVAKRKGSNWYQSEEPGRRFPYSGQFSDTSDFEKIYGKTIYNISGTLNAYILED